MKTKLIYTAIIFLISFNCKAQILDSNQQIIPVEDHYDILFGLNLTQINPGDHIKDVNNVLDKYVGIWVGTYNNRNYEFRITEFSEVTEGITNDILHIRYKITDVNGTIIGNTTNLNSESPLIIIGLYLTNTGFYVSYFVGPNGKCGQSGNLHIIVTENNTKLGVIFFPEPDIIDGSECTQAVDFLFPQTYTLFDKQ